MTTQEAEQTTSEIERLIKGYLFCNSIITILRQPIEPETKKQCLIELRNKGYEMNGLTKVEVKKLRSELKQIKNRVLDLKKQLTPTQLHLYKSRVAWTS